MSLDDLKNRIKDYPISEIIGRYIPVTKKGPRHSAVCPFHDDHNPSLSINDEKGFFMCFVDNTGGDAIKFVQEYKKLDFIDSLRDICEKMGWNFDDYKSPVKRHPKFDLAEKILQRAAQLYMKVAETNPPEFREFIKKRKIDERTMREFSIGFAPKDSVVTSYLGSLKDDGERMRAIETACAIHLIRPDKGGKGYYDTFRERIMFPVRGRSGRIIGFCGRQTKDYQKGKYINSQESFIFEKKAILYALPEAKNEIRQRDAAILVEGHMDCVVLHQYGFSNSVALMGIALGSGTLSQLESLTKHLYTAMDNDPAGFEAMKRINALCMGRGLLPKRVDITPHKDPDEFLVKEGRLALDGRIREAIPCIDVLLEAEMPERALEVVDRQIEVLQKGFRLLSPLGMSLAATERAMDIARRLGMASSPEQITASYREFLAHNRVTPPLAARDPREEPAPEEASLEEPAVAVTKAEASLLREILLNPRLTEITLCDNIVDFLEKNAIKDYIGKLKYLYCEIEENGYKETAADVVLQSPFDKATKKALRACLDGYDGGIQNEEMLGKIAQDLLARLKRDRLIAMKDRLKEKQKTVTSSQESESILKELSHIERRIHV